MKFYQSFHGALQDGAQLHAKAFGCLFEFGGEGVGDGANEVDGEPGTAILLDVAHEEVGEALDQQLVHLGYLAMFREEGGEAGKETVGQVLAIYFFQYNLLCELILGKELIAECFGELALEAVAHKTAAQYGAATLVAKDVAEGGDVGGDFLTIVEA